MAKLTVTFGLKRAWWVNPLALLVKLAIKAGVRFDEDRLVDWFVRHGYRPTIDGKPTTWS